MTGEAQADVHIGLSEEEREDLHKLISAFSAERSSESGDDQLGGPISIDSTDVDQRMEEMTSNIAEFSEKIRRLDAKTKSTSADVDQRMRQMGSNIAGFGEKMLQFDTKIKALYKILLLSQKKTELMNKHIDAILEMIVDIKDV
ncbi:MAG: hypothetical protein JSV50_19330 [Desulfobacteraceae bacterium]|nr:MAG: hypothetical protein JSV50_19330 [Desulfobacteraceae bacterium]